MVPHKPGFSLLSKEYSQPLQELNLTTNIIETYDIGFSGGASGKESTCGFNPQIGKVPWKRKWHHTPVFLPGIPWTEEPGGLQSVASQIVGHDRVTAHMSMAWETCIGF